MFTKIMTPVDLLHIGDLGKGLQCGADLARLYDASVVYVGITSTAPSAAAHNPAEYAAKLADFAAAQADRHGIRTEAHAAISHDPTTDLDDALLGAVTDTGADLVVMTSHLPNLTDYLWPSNGGKIATHAACTVMVVRG
ncbi:universal stress protein [Seohaeicola saemankumensis]|nr:universal stress protein [Seohaeicola saemankumensis]MCA0872309.1 universal stress protein [Seohaeicola saemankumensis]